MHPEWRDQIAAGARASGLELSEEQLLRIVSHLEALERASATLNLTAVSPDDYAALHVLDSLVAAPLLEEAPEGPFADLGTGAGFPGIPLAVASGRHVDLIEATGKKARFLETFVADSCLKATVRNVRAEEAAGSPAKTYSAVVARAVTALPSLAELGAPLLVRGGRLLCLKGSLSDEERERGRSAARIVGLSEVECRSVEVPGLDAERAIVVYERTGKPSVPLPRRPGMAQRHPLT
jgi:16S rRNA (guanine527-N7)-methyltransferase